VTFVKGMRESYPDVCWRLIANGERCCIRDRGHDDGIHEEGGAGAGRGVHPASEDRRSAAGSGSGGREDLAHNTRRMLQALDGYWLHCDGLPPGRYPRGRYDSEDWWDRFEKYRGKVVTLL
jgi:hypothetical protein